MRRELLGCTFLAICIFALYAPVRSFDFIFYDDPVYVTSNSHVTTGLSLDNATWAFTTPHGANWHPLTWLSHQLDVSLFGSQAGGHHLMNVALHALNASLLLLILSRLTGRFWLAVITAAMFAAHPLRVESVAWISERKDLLCAFFFLLTIATYAWYVRLTSVWRYALVAFVMILALLSKPMAVTLPFVLLLLDYWPLGRFRYDGLKSFRSLALEKLPLLALVVASSIATFHVQSTGGAMRSSGDFPLAARLGNAVISYVRYIAHIFWPSDLVILYPHPGAWPAVMLLGAVVILSAITIFVIIQARNRPYLLVGWLWFLGVLVPTIGIVQVGQQSMADRYTYLPSIGLTFAIVWFIGDLVQNRIALQRLTATVAIVAVVALSIMTYRQVAVWRGGSVALFQRAITLTDKNWVAHWQLGTELMSRHDASGAAAHLQAAIAIQPNWPDLQFNWGNLLMQTGHIDEAIAAYRNAISRRPDFVEAWTNLGVIYASSEQWPAAVESFRRAMIAAPDNVEVRNNWNKAREHLASSRKSPATTQTRTE